MLDNYSLSFCQIKEIKDKLKALRWNAKETFDGLQQCVEKRRQEVNKMMQVEEDDTMKALLELERLRAAVISKAATMEKVTESASDLHLLIMYSNLTSHLNNLESWTRKTNRITVVDFSVDSLKLDQLRDDITRLGTV